MTNTASQQSGFTLIELIIVVTLSIMLLLAASSLFMTMLIGNTKTSSSQLLKSEGTAAMNQIEFLVRNAVDVQNCQASSDTLTIKSLDGGLTTFGAVEDQTDSQFKIASNSAAFLTSGSVELVNDRINFTCAESADGFSHYVTVNFSLRKGTPGIDEARDIVTETFQSSINLRSF